MMFVHSKLPGVLLDLAHKRQSGVLRVQQASAKKQLVLNKGILAFAESNLPDEHLVRIMVDLDYLKKSDISEVISLMKTGKNCEEAVTAVNQSGRETVESAVREHIIVVLSSMLGWPECKMRFFNGENLIENRTSMKMSMPEALVFSARRAASRQLINLPEEFLLGTIVSNKAVSVKNMGFPLNESESYAYARAHDSISAHELMPLIPAADATPEEVLQSLYALGLIDAKPSQDVPYSDAKESVVNESYLEIIEDLLAHFENAGLYETLSVEKDASRNQIQDAYHDLARKYHPDRFQSEKFSNSLRSQVEQVFSFINTAYVTLRDPGLRFNYDEKIRKEGDRTKDPKKAKTSTNAAEAETIESLFRLGRRSLTQREFEKAAKELKSCVHLRPENAQYNYFLGLAESEVPSLYKSAEQHFFKVIELEPSAVDTRIALVKLYLKVRLRRKANLMLDEVLRWDPDNPKAVKLREQINK